MNEYDVHTLHLLEHKGRSLPPLLDHPLTFLCVVSSLIGCGVRQCVLSLPRNAGVVYFCLGHRVESRIMQFSLSQLQHVPVPLLLLPLLRSEQIFRDAFPFVDPVCRERGRCLCGDELERQVRRQGAILRNTCVYR